MHDPKVVWQFVAVGFSVGSAAFWLASALMGPKPTRNGNPPGGFGDLMFQTGENEWIVWNIRRQGYVNATAAILTALAAAAQGWAIYLQLPN